MLRNILKLPPHILFEKGAEQTNKKSYLGWQSKSVFDLQDLHEPPDLFSFLFLDSFFPRFDFHWITFRVDLF